MLVFAQFFRRWHVRERYVNFAVPDEDLLDDGFNDFTSVRNRQRRPAVVKGIGLVEDIVGRQLVNLEQINLGFELSSMPSAVPPLFGWLGSKGQRKQWVRTQSFPICFRAWVPCASCRSAAAY
jgi:hypothetical protein